MNKPGAAGWIQPQTSVKLVSERALKSRAVDALCKTVSLQNPPRATLLTGYFSPAPLQAISSLHKSLHCLNQLFKPEVACAGRWKSAAEPRRGSVTHSFPQQDRLFPCYCRPELEFAYRKTSLKYTLLQYGWQLKAFKRKFFHWKIWLCPGLEFVKDWSL